ncbi:MAG: cytochrome c-type biogenesis protein CcmH [Dehalococcoidia bacterium]|nr:MAG: cytochrome c-type biogenesis protein CcmH [Dehalococcoidia bacterium]
MTRRMSSLLLALALLAVAPLAAPPASAQVPPSSDPRIEAQALVIEKQLLCPLCTNERLDICGTVVCVDMKRIIREQLAAGATPDEIIFYFEQRYGERVRADLHRDGFNLILFGWVGASVLLVAAGGAWFLLSARRTKALASGPNSTGVDEAWLDAQIADGEEKPEARA